MKIAVITPYSTETTEVISRCIESVAQQTHPCSHLLVGDGSRYSGKGDVQHFHLPLAHHDYGDTPRLIGSISAYSQGFDGICWLDADCWFDPNHVEILLGIANREVSSVVTATRNLRRTDGSLLAVCGESDGNAFCDTNCYLVMRDAIPVLAPLWGFKPTTDAVVGDRRVWQAAKAFSHAHSSIPTVNYDTNIAAHYLAVGEQPPPHARVIMQPDRDHHFVSFPYWSLVSQMG